MTVIPRTCQYCALGSFLICNLTGDVLITMETHTCKNRQQSHWAPAWQANQERIERAEAKERAAKTWQYDLFDNKS